jgi:hypothetical protein
MMQRRALQEAEQQHGNRRDNSVVCAGRLASGDSEGCVVVWEIATATPVLSLEDPLQAASANGKKSEPGKSGAVRGLAWVCANPARLAIVLASGVVLVWDVQGELVSPSACLLLLMCLAKA